MEICPVPRRRRGRLAARLSWLLAPLAVAAALVAALVTSLGLHVCVLDNDGMGGTLDRGAVVFAREVPSADLRVGDVIVAEPATWTGVDGQVALRITKKAATGVHARGDVSDSGFVLPLAAPESRVAFHVPWVGYPLLGPPLLVLVGLGSLLALLSLLGVTWRRTGSLIPSPRRSSTSPGEVDVARAAQR